MLATTRPDPSALDFACAGETLGMFVPSRPHDLDTDALGHALSAAGAESNVAVYLSRLGNRVGWLSRLGGDQVGEFILDVLRHEGVRLDHVEIDPDRQTGIAIKEVRPGATTVRYYRRESAASQLSPAHAQALLALSPAAIHVTGITAALSESARGFLSALFEQVPSTIRMSFDVNLRAQLWQQSPAQLLMGYATRSQTVFVGLDEAHTLWNCSDPTSVRELFPNTPTLVVKQGPDGATVFHGLDAVFVPSLGVRVVEPVGAGDAFAAGFLHAQRSGMSPRDCARLGTIMASVSLSSLTDIGPMPSEAYIQYLLGLSDSGWQKEEFAVEAVTQ